MIATRLTYAACVLSAASLAAGFALRGFIPGSLVIGLLGVVWLLAVVRRWTGVSSGMFVVFGILSAILVQLEAPTFLEVIALGAALAAWGLPYSHTRLDRIRSPEMARSVQVHHLTRLAAIVGAGMLVTAAALLIRIQLSFAVALLSGVVALFALIQVISRLAWRPGRSRDRRPPDLSPR